MAKTIDFKRISKSYLQGFKTCEIANQVLRVIIQQGADKAIITKNDIDTFKKEKGKRTSTFMLTQPLLSTTIYDVGGHISYYADPIVCYGETLYLNSQWYADSERKENLINWIVNWIACNGGRINPTKKIYTNTYKPLVIKGKEQKPDPFVIHGADAEDWPIVYAKNVLSEEQVPQLCGRLKGEYYGVLDFAKTVFHDFFDLQDLKAIPVVLKKECPSKIYINSDEYVTEQINKLVKQKKTITTLETAKILRFDDRVSGEFVEQGEDCDGPYIVIYFNQYSAHSWDDYIAMIVKTLAHEYAHYCEYVYCNKHHKKSYQDERVSEAVADLFGVLYSIKIGNIQVAEDRYKLWKKRLDSGWPYAFAWYFYIIKKIKLSFTDVFPEYYDNGIIDKLIEVFAATLDSEIALDILIS